MKIDIQPLRLFRVWCKGQDCSCWKKAREQQTPEPPRQKAFTKVNVNIPERKEYSGAGSGDLGEDYWVAWKSYKFKEIGKDKSWVDGRVFQLLI